MYTEDVLRKAVEQGAADIFLIPGMPLSWKVGGKILYQTDEKIFPKEIEAVSYTHLTLPTTSRV